MAGFGAAGTQLPAFSECLVWHPHASVDPAVAEVLQPQLEQWEATPLRELLYAVLLYGAVQLMTLLL